MNSMITGFWYLGSPYSKFPDGIDAANTAVCIEAARLVKAGVPVFSPIAHTHPIAIIGGVDPFDLTLWLALDRPMMDAAKGLIILQMDGWRHSHGLAHEIEVFRAAGKRIIFMEPGTVPSELLGAAG